MYYRKDLLEQAGVDYSDIEEWSFEDLYAACEKLKTVMPQNQGKYPMLGFDFRRSGLGDSGIAGQSHGRATSASARIGRKSSSIRRL